MIRRLAVKGFDGRGIITEILEIDAERRRLQQKCDSDASELKKLAFAAEMRFRRLRA